MKSLITLFNLQTRLLKNVTAEVNDTDAQTQMNANTIGQLGIARSNQHRNSMGVRGSKMSHGSVEAAEFLVSKLSAINGISSKRMFGGHGIFHDGKMFGIVDPKGACYLKADNTNRSDFEAKGSNQHSRMPYFSIPDLVMDDAAVLTEWAKRSIAIANS